MFLRHSKIVAAAALLLASSAMAAGAAVLWDQSPLDLAAAGIANSKSPGFGGFTTYSVNDVTVPASGWTINTITEYYSDWTYWSNANAGTGYLIIMPKTGSLPVGAPSLTTIVPLTWVDTVISGQGVNVMTAAGLSVVLPAGSYWITVSPIAPNDPFNGPDLQWPSSVHSGAAIASYDTAWHNFYGSTGEGAFKIDGLLGGATPTIHGSWGSLKALYR
jgi:hypothetical protein